MSVALKQIHWLYGYYYYHHDIVFYYSKHGIPKRTRVQKLIKNDPMGLSLSWSCFHYTCNVSMSKVDPPTLTNASILIYKIICIFVS